MEKETMCFKQWSRKGYGIFASLGKVVKIGVLTCSLIVMNPQKGFAGQTDTTHTVLTADVEVIAHRQHQHINLSHVLTVVDSDEIAHAPAQTLGDLLRYVSGVDIRQRGVNGVQADVSVRGGTFDQAVILLNGVNITDPQTGHYNLNLPVDLSSINRIEILKLPNAFSGAINIVTGEKQTTDNKRIAEIQTQLTGGQHGLITGEASAKIAAGKHITTLTSLSHSRSEGYAFDTDFNITNAFAQVRINSPQTGNINIQGGFQDKAAGAYGFYSLNPLYANQFDHTRTFFASATADKSWNKFTFFPKIYWRQHHNRYELFRDFTSAPDWYTSHNYHKTDALGASLSASYLWKWGKSSAGADYRLEHIYSNALGEPLPSPRHVPFEGNALFTKAKARQNLHYFLNHALYLRRFSATASLLGNYCNDFGSNFYFGADASYAITNELKVYATVNQSLRLPTFTDLYLSNATQQGNPALKPERAMTYEAGAKFYRKQFNADVAVFFRQGKDVIDWVKFDPADTKYVAVNHAEVNALGSEMSAEYTPEIPVLKRVKLSYACMALDKKSDAFDSKYSLDYLRHKIMFDLDLTVYKGFSAHARISWADRAGNYTNADGVFTDYKPFFLADLRLQWTEGKITVFGEASNIFNKKYADYGGIVQPGRWIRCGIEVKL